MEQANEWRTARRPPGASGDRGSTASGSVFRVPEASIIVPQAIATAAPLPWYRFGRQVQVG